MPWRESDRTVGCCDEYGGGGIGGYRESRMDGWDGGLEKGCCAECRGSMIEVEVVGESGKCSITRCKQHGIYLVAGFRSREVRRLRRQVLERRD